MFSRNVVLLAAALLLKEDHTNARSIKVKIGGAASSRLRFSGPLMSEH